MVGKQQKSHWPHGSGRILKKKSIKEILIPLSWNLWKKHLNDGMQSHVDSGLSWYVSVLTLHECGSSFHYSMQIQVLLKLWMPWSYKLVPSNRYLGDWRDGFANSYELRACSALRELGLRHCCTVRTTVYVNSSYTMNETNQAFAPYRAQTLLSMDNSFPATADKSEWLSLNSCCPWPVPLFKYIVGRPSYKLSGSQTVLRNLGRTCTGWFLIVSFGSWYMMWHD